MVNRGFPLHGGPIAVMLSEHEAGRAFIRGMAEGAAKVGRDPAAARQLVENGRGYIGLLRAHIHKENNILFPMADNILSPEDQAELEKAFERFEVEETGAGVHEASLKLLDELQAGVR
jgi:hemerythrin-like domain-containing protein